MNTTDKNNYGDDDFDFGAENLRVCDEIGRACGCGRGAALVAMLRMRDIREKPSNEAERLAWNHIHGRGFSGEGKGGK